MKTYWLILVFFTLISLASAQVVESTQFKPKHPTDTEVTEESARAQNKKILDGYDSELRANPEKEEKIRKAKFQILFRGINGVFNIDYAVPPYQKFQLEIIHEHPEWASLILDYCHKNPFELSATNEEKDLARLGEVQLYHFRALEMLPHHPGCSWENSRVVYREVLARYRMARHYMNYVDREAYYVRQRPPMAEPPASRGPVSEENFLRKMMYSIPGILARFPTADGVEELCQQLEAWPGSETLSAANALSVCTGLTTVDRVRRAFATARSTRLAIRPNENQNPLEYQRLERRLTDLNADLSGMIEGAGFRFIKPDWNAAKDTTWNLTPPPSTQPQPFAAAPVLPSESAPACWPWLLLALLPVGLIAGWVLGRRHAAKA